MNKRQSPIRVIQPTIDREIISTWEKSDIAQRLLWLLFVKAALRRPNDLRGIVRPSICLNNGDVLSIQANGIVTSSPRVNVSRRYTAAEVVCKGSLIQHCDGYPFADGTVLYANLPLSILSQHIQKCGGISRDSLSYMLPSGKKTLATALLQAFGETKYQVYVQMLPNQMSWGEQSTIVNAANVWGALFQAYYYFPGPWLSVEVFDTTNV